RVLDLKRVEREERAADQCDLGAEQAPEQQEEDESSRSGEHDGGRARGPLATIAAGEKVERAEVEAPVRLAVHDQVAEPMPGQACERDADGLVAREPLRAETRQAGGERQRNRNDRRRASQV